jgi:hypothetical protein
MDSNCRSPAAVKLAEPPVDSRSWDSIARPLVNWPARRPEIAGLKQNDGWLPWVRVESLRQHCRLQPALVVARQTNNGTFPKSQQAHGSFDRAVLSLRR